MIFWHRREEARKERTDHSAEERDDATAFANFHQTHPQRKDASEANGNLECLSRRIECRIHDVAPYREIAIHHRVDERNRKSDKEGSDPDII